MRLEEATQCILVVIGSTAEGKKELLALTDGFRESEESWKDVLRDLPRRGLTVETRRAIGDGALGFWKALPQVWGHTRTQRCWVHKTVKVLNQFPKHLQANAKSALHQIWMAATREHVQQAFEAFLTTYAPNIRRRPSALRRTRRPYSPATTSRPNTGITFGERTRSSQPLPRCGCGRRKPAAVCRAQVSSRWCSSWPRVPRAIG